MSAELKQERPSPEKNGLGHSLFADKPDRQWRLPNKLAEISGLAVTTDGRLLCHDDERAVFYQLDVETGRCMCKFAMGDPPAEGDFEGLATTDTDDVYVIMSCGRMYRSRLGADGERLAYDVFDTGLGNVGEVEGLAYHAGDKRLIIAVKSHYERGLRDVVGLYAWSARGGEAKPWLMVPMADIAEAAGVSKFKPSGVEIDARTGRIVLVAARHRAMAELSADGAVLAARQLGKRHPQAEGVTIMPDGALVVADEAVTGRARLTRYPRL